MMLNARPSPPAEAVRDRRRLLFTNWECGGHVDPALLVARQCQAMGHEVLFVSDEANRQAATSLGIPFRHWTTAPNRQILGDRAEGLKDWRAWTPLGVVDTICREVITGPAAAYAADTTALIRSFRPDMIVTNELLFGCIIAAESAGIPCALLTGNLWCFPTRLDAPPFGPGFAPSNAAYARIRDHLVRRMLRPLYGRHTAALNRARADHGLPRLRNLLDQTGAATAIVLGVSRTFDIGDRTPPSPFFYAGPLLRIPVWAASNVARIDDAPDATPRVVVSFGTTEQGQARVIARCIRALARLPVSAIVTTGPAVRPQDLPVASNVRVVQSASHDEIVPGSAAMICHGGHGTLIRPIIHGVPLLCLPMGRDQYDNSARIVSRGAGLKLSARSGAGRIARAVRRLIDDPRFRQNAAALGRAVSDETDQGARAARHLIAVIQATAGAGRMAG